MLTSYVTRGHDCVEVTVNFMLEHAGWFMTYISTWNFLPL